MATIYSKALAGFLKGSTSQEALGDAVGCTQAAISRYASGQRLPPREIAEKIERETDGLVPVSLWRVVAAEKAGIAA